MAYVTRTHGERPHAKFQPPTMTGLAVHKGQTRGQNKGNANIYVDPSSAQCLKITQNVAFEFWHFPPISITCLVTLFDSKFQVFNIKRDFF